MTSVAVASLSGLVLSGCVEFLQLFAPTRTTSLVDLGTNLAGSVIGGLVGWPLARWAWPLARPGMRRMAGDCPMLAMGWVVAAGAAGLGDVSLRHQPRRG